MSAEPLQAGFTLTKRGLLWHWEVKTNGQRIGGGTTWRRRTARADALACVQITKWLVETERVRNA